MTSLFVASDLHVETSTFTPSKIALESDIALLTGDIGAGPIGLDWVIDFYHQRQKPIVYIPGNHEYRGYPVHALEGLWRQASKEYPEIHILTKGSCDIHGIRFLGCTLWSDFSFFDPSNRDKAMAFANTTMPEYLQGLIDNRRLQAKDTLSWHISHRQWLHDELKKDYSGPTVVATHHAPHAKSIHTKYNHQLLTTAFVSHLDELLGMHNGYWFHGHTHYCVDYMVQKSRIISNARGYSRIANMGDPHFNANFQVIVEK